PHVRRNQPIDASAVDCVPESRVLEVGASKSKREPDHRRDQHEAKRKAPASRFLRSAPPNAITERCNRWDAAHSGLLSGPLGGLFLHSFDQDTRGGFAHDARVRELTGLK